MVATTRVVYDVSHAVSELRKLNQRVQESGDTAEKAFRQGKDAADVFERGLGRVDSRAGRVVGTIRNVAAAFGPMGVAATGVGVAIGGLALQLIDLPEAFRDPISQIDGFNEALKNSSELLIRVRDIVDADVMRGFELRGREIKERQVRIAEQQIELSDRKATLDQKLAMEKRHLAQINAEARNALSERRSIEQRLLDIRERRQDAQDAGLPVGQQILRTLERAGAARESGDFDRAERLLAKAEQLTQQQGGHGFFTTRLIAEQEQLERTLEGLADARQKEAAGLQAQASARQQSVADLTRERQQVTERERQLRNETRQARADRRSLSVEQDQFVDTDRAEEGVQRLTNLVTRMGNVANAERTKIQATVDLFRGVGTAFLGGERVVNDTQAVSALRERAREAVSELGSGDLERQKAALKELADIELERSRIQETAGTSSAFNRDFEQLQKLVPLAREYAEELARTRQHGGSFGAVTTQSVQIGGTTVQVPTPAQSATSAQQSPAATPQNVNVNVQVRGGMIDDDTVRVLSDKIERNLRRGTVRPSNN